METAQTETLFPLPDPGDPQRGKVEAEHPDTSQRAADLVAPRAGTQRHNILEVLWADWLYGPSMLHPGLTCAAVAERVGLSRNQCATRMMELRESGWVEYVTTDRFPNANTEAATEGGNMAKLQVLTERGIAAMAGTRVPRPYIR